QHAVNGGRLVVVIGDRRRCTGGTQGAAVVGGGCEAIGVGGVRVGGGVRRGQRHRADRRPRLAVHAGDRVGRRVRTAVIGHAVGRDRHRRGRLVDRIGERRRCTGRTQGAAVVGGGCEAIGVAGVRVGGGVRRGQRHRKSGGQRLAVDAGERVGRRGRTAVIGHAVGRAR